MAIAMRTATATTVIIMRIMTVRAAAAAIAVANVRGRERRGVLSRVRDLLSRQGTCARRMPAGRPKFSNRTRASATNSAYPGNVGLERRIGTTGVSGGAGINKSLGSTAMGEPKFNDTPQAMDDVFATNVTGLTKNHLTIISISP